MKTFILKEEQGITKNIKCNSIDEAITVAHEWAAEGDYNDPESTIWIDTLILDEDGDIADKVITSINPKEPKCISSKHDWQSPIEFVGGIKENPGVFGNGGGVIIIEACMNCGCKRTVNTWATRPDNGIQGLTSIKYDENTFDILDAAE